MVDSFGRKIEYMRISITDRCNLRCKYCMPDGIESSPMSDILTYEEITEIVRVSAGLGINKIKITGGDPLVRKGCPDLISMLKKVDGIEEVTLTTNGILLPENIEALKSAGVDGINISLDTYDRDCFKELTGVDGFTRVLDGIDASLKSGIKTKINAVSIKRDEKVLSDDFINLIELARNNKVDVRFIEIMPIGNGKDFEGLGNDRLIDEISKRYEGFSRDISIHGNGPAIYYKIPDFMGSIGFISAIHEKFCSSCNRVRLSSKGYLKACLCFKNGGDLMPILRGDSLKKEELLKKKIEEVIFLKPLAHCFENMEEITETAYMTSIGG